jgi:uncharacterized protein YdhG (YjbR/CyaY superfamily)
MRLTPTPSTEEAAAMADTGTPAKRPASRASAGFSDVERAAMQDAVKERRKAARRGPADEADGERDVLAKIAEMPDPDRVMAERIHALIRAAAPELTPRTFYGMPAYAKNGKVLCFFQAASKFKVRYATFGFQHDARIDDGTMWPVSFALLELTPANEARILELVRKAAG